MRSSTAALRLACALLLAGCFADHSFESDDHHDCVPDESWVGQSLHADVAWGTDNHLVHWVTGDTNTVRTVPVTPDGALGETQVLDSGRGGAQLVSTSSGFRLLAATLYPVRGIITMGLDAEGRPVSGWNTAASWDQDINSSSRELAATYDGDRLWVAVSSDPGGLDEPETVRLVRLADNGASVDSQTIVVAELYEQSLHALAIARVGEIAWLVWEYSFYDRNQGQRHAIEGARIALDGTVLERGILLLDDARHPRLTVLGDRVLLAAKARGLALTLLLDEAGPVRTQPVWLESVRDEVLQIVPAADDSGYLMLVRHGSTAFPCDDCTIDVQPLSADYGALAGPPLLTVSAVDAVLSPNDTGSLLATISHEATGDDGVTRLQLQAMSSDGTLGAPLSLGESRASYERVVCD